jgi:hypothetical protein
LVDPRRSAVRLSVARPPRGVRRLHGTHR